MNDGPVDDQARHEVRTPGVGHAVHRPNAPVLGEVRGMRRVPILGVGDSRACGPRPEDLDVGDGEDILAAWHVKTATAIRKIVLEVHDKEGGPGAVGDVYSVHLTPCPPGRLPPKVIVFVAIPGRVGHDNRMGVALLTDLYELTMASSYFRQNMTAPATFSLFVRRLPPTRGFIVAAGLEECLEFLEALRFDDEDLAYLASQGFGDDTLDAFASLRFTGDVWAIPEGRLVLADEPLLEVTAPMPEAQLVETFLLNKLSLHSAIASKAARCVIAAQGRFELVDFGMRRTQGLEAAMAVARVSAMVGFDATSNVEAARHFGLNASGTMAHSYVEAFPNELEAFRAFAGDLPERTTFLVDTYDTLTGVAHAIEVIRELGLGNHIGIRLDSGDLSTLAHEARRLLDTSGLSEVRIVVSGSLDEHRIARLVSDGAPVDVAGVGTRMAVSADAPYLDTAYKLVAYDGRPVAKLSTDKATYPGEKQVFRTAGFRDVLGMRQERPPAGSTPILEQVMENGRRLRPPETLEVQRVRFQTDCADLPTSAMELVDPVAPSAEVSVALATLTERVRNEIRRQERSAL